MNTATVGRLQAVTGAFGYSGRHIAKRLLERGHPVVTLTNSVADDPFDGRIKAHPLNFARPEKLTEALQGVDVLYNTYWVRFNHRRFSYAGAVTNTKLLFAAALEAGVRRIVHVSITNPSEASALEYFRGKAELETELRSSGISYAILRPTVLFGEGGILINNIAWMLRHFPVFGLFGDGSYRLQPVHVDDLARAAVSHGAGETHVVVNVNGPETFTYRELVKTIGAAIGRPRPTIPLPPWLAYGAAVALGPLLGDVLITRDEIRGLMEERLWVAGPATGTTSLTRWAKEHGALLGKNYASELARRTGTGRRTPADNGQRLPLKPPGP
ncbi:MAG: NAD-dependent epimerase/dehydratase family protein [Gemmatimonadota bacterium]